ncbi:hypothetical protein VTK73DRAFT_3956 [Phialemonium thermophilum]|uniref:Uncharacterized protein n=1 Tax=Phialemonium thermophilum TaxID=223376 RepID=A0ABR3XZI1_9PEZI
MLLCARLVVDQGTLPAQSPAQNQAARLLNTLGKVPTPQRLKIHNKSGYRMYLDLVPGSVPGPPSGLVDLPHQSQTLFVSSLSLTPQFLTLPFASQESLPQSSAINQTICEALATGSQTSGLSRRPFVVQHFSLSFVACFEYDILLSATFYLEEWLQAEDPSGLIASLIYA